MADNTMVVKMTVNSKEFDNGLQNAKASMNTFDSKIKTVSSSFKESLGGVTMAFGAVSAAIGVAKTAMDTYQKVMRSTEQGADKLDRAMNQVTVVTNKFFQSLANGSFTSFLDGLSDIAKNAREAYDALDNLGTLKMWSGSRINELKASIAEDRVIVNSASTTAEEKSAAQARISVNMDKIKALSGDIADATVTAMDAKLREMSGAAKEVTNDMLKSYVEMFQNGTLYDESVKFMREHSQQVTSTATYVGNQEGIPAYKQQVTSTKWDSELNRKIYEAMNTLATLTEGEGGWQDYYKLIDELSAQRLNIANQENRANTAVDKNTGGGSSSSGNTQKVTVEIEPKMDVNQLAQYIWNNKTIDSVPYTDLGIPAEDIVEPGTDQIIERVNEQLEEERKRMEALTETTKMGITAMNAFGSALGYIGSMAGDSTFAKITSSLGSVISQAASTVSAMMSLAGAETIEGLAETFSKAPVGTKIALTATALGGILGMMASVKSAFAGSFAEGGVVPGSSYTGDKLIARVNSGERILTSRQWYDLVNAISMMESYREEVSNAVDEHAAKARISANAIPIAKSNENRGVRLLSAAESGAMRINSNAFHDAKAQDRNVRFVIEGSQLRGVLDNYDKINKL